MNFLFPTVHLVDMQLRSSPASIVSCRCLRVQSWLSYHGWRSELDLLMDESIKEGVRRTWRKDRMISRISRRWDLQLLVFKLDPRLALGDINLFNFDRLMERLNRAFTSPLLALPAPLPIAPLPQLATTAQLISEVSTAEFNTTASASLHCLTPVHQPLNSSRASPTRVVLVGPNATGIVVAVLGPAVNEATALAIPLPIFVPRPATSLIIAKFDHHAAVSETSVVPWAPTCELERRASGYRDESRAVVLRAASASPRWPRLMCSLTYWRDVVISFLILVLVVRACGNRNSVELLPLVLGVPAR